MSDTFVDPYLDPATGILRNLVGAKTYDELNNAEGELVSARTVEFLTVLPFHASGTLEDLCRIHGWLFQDIYDWAGKVRTVEIRKASEGSQFFLTSGNIAMGVAWARDELVKDSFLVDMPRDIFINRLSYHYDNYNFIHPFREGNGRTQRLLWTLICHDAGYALDWRLVSGAENDEASRLAAEDLDLGGLESMFDKICVSVDPSIPINADLLSSGHLNEGEGE